MLEIRDLRLKDEDLIFDGDLRLIGDTKIENGSLIVNGNLVLVQTEICSPSLEIFGGNLTAGSLLVENKMGHIYQDQLICLFFYVDGDIHITNGSFVIGERAIAHAGNIFIENGDLGCGGISKSLSLYVSGRIFSFGSINVLFDIFCYTANIYGTTYCGGDLYAKNHFDSHGNSIYVKGSFKTNDL